MKSESTPVMPKPSMSNESGRNASNNAVINDPSKTYGEDEYVEKEDGYATDLVVLASKNALKNEVTNGEKEYVEGDMEYEIDLVVLE